MISFRNRNCSYNDDHSRPNQTKPISLSLSLMTRKETWMNYPTPKNLYLNNLHPINHLISTSIPTTPQSPSPLAVSINEPCPAFNQPLLAQNKIHQVPGSRHRISFRITDRVDVMERTSHLGFGIQMNLLSAKAR